ncbi:MAG TPA: thioesterase domain-containing protein, partial [Myxococcus sp.]|nr:thioesterase domain-containing protein [Myxococcus sp.]
AARGRLMQALPAGAMTAVSLPEDGLRPLLGPRLSLAAVNAPSSCVASGPLPDIEALEQRLSRSGVGFHRLRTSHAFHSEMMEPVLEAFAAEVRRVPLSAPAIPLVSNVTGTWLTEAEATDASYWVRHLRQPVRFLDGLASLAATPDPLLLEVGPGRTLCGLAGLALGPGGAPAIASLGGGDPAEADVEVLASLGRLWCEGVDVDWRGFGAGERRQRVPLPTYPWDSQRYWLEAPAAPVARPPERPLEELEAELRRELAIRPIESYPGLEESLHALCSSHILRFFQAGGLDVHAGARHHRAEAERRLRIDPRFTRFFEAMLSGLEEDGLIRRDGDTFVFQRGGAELAPPEALRLGLDERFPGFAGLVDWVEHAMRSYPRSLTGEMEAIGVLYPGGSARFAQDCEARTVEHRTERVYYQLLTEVVRRAAGKAAGRKLRILEVGGGQGLLTWPLLAALEDVEVEYHFTDLGRVFVDDARQEAARRGWEGRMRFGLLDIARPPGEQGYEEGTFDLVLAFNVVHAVRDVRVALRNLASLLGQGGSIGLVELVRIRRWEVLSWGLAEGWWYFDDGLRERSPLLPLETWARVLEEEGFEGAECLPRAGGEREAPEHGLVLARRRGVPARLPGPRTMYPRHELGTAYVPPRTELEQRIARICQELLGVERVGLRDDFFELGADSLITLRLTERLGRELGREVPPGAAFRGLTVEKMARALEASPPPPEEGSPLVPLQPHGSRPPLFFVHPASGVVFPFVQLARKLGTEQPFYGLQALGLDGTAPPQERVEDMARSYLEAVRARQPSGPFYLGGFSFGCLVAYEMALQLETAGEQVAMLALVDEPAPLPGHRPSLLEMGRVLAEAATRTAWPFLHDYLYLRGAAEEPPRAAGLSRAWSAVSRWPGARQAVKGFLARSTMAALVLPESQALALGQPAMLPMFQLFLIHARRTFDYLPRRYRGSIILFTTEQVRRMRGGGEPTMGWHRLVDGGVEVHELPGEHLLVLREPNVGLLAERMAASLERARRGARTRRPATG